MALTKRTGVARSLSFLWNKGRAYREAALARRPFLRYLWRVGAFLRNTPDTLRHEGLSVLLWQGLRLALSPIASLDLVTFYKCDLTQAISELAARAPVTIGMATEADMARLAGMMTLSLSADPLMERLRRGDVCFLAKVEGQIAHFNWINFHDLACGPLAPDVRIPLRDGEAYTYDGHTVVPWRGTGIHGAVNSRMLLFLKETGYCKAYTWAKTDNLRSRKGLRPLWKTTGTFLSLRPRRTGRVFVVRLSGAFEPIGTRVRYTSLMGSRLVTFSPADSGT